MLAPTVTPSFVFTASTVELRLQASSSIPAGATIQIIFPSFFPEFNIQYVDVATLAVTPVQNVQPGVTFSYSAVTSELTISGAFSASGLSSGTQVRMNIAGIILPATTSAITNIRVALLTSENRRFNRNDAVSLQASLPVVTTNNQASLSATLVGATSRIIYTFTVPGPIGSGYVLSVSSTNFELTSCSMVTSVGFISPSCSSVTFTNSQNKLSTITLVLTNVANSNIAVPGTIGLTIRDSSGQSAYTSPIQTFNFTLQTMNNLAVTAVKPNLGVDSPLKLLFTSMMPYPMSTKLLVRLPPSLQLKGTVSCNLDGIAQPCSTIDSSTIQVSFPSTKNAGSQTTLIINTISLPLCSTATSVVSIEAQLIEKSQANMAALTASSFGTGLTQNSFNVLGTNNLQFTLSTVAMIRIGSSISIHLPAELLGQESIPCTVLGASATAICSSSAQGVFSIANIAISNDLPSNTVLTLKMGAFTNPRAVGTFNFIISVLSAAPTACIYSSSSFSMSVASPSSFTTLSLVPSLTTLSSFHLLKMTYTLPSSQGSLSTAAQLLPTDTFNLVIPSGILSSTSNFAFSISATIAAPEFSYIMSPGAASQSTYIVEQRDSQSRVVRRGTYAINYSGAASFQAALNFNNRALMGQISKKTLAITSPSYLDQAQQVKLNLPSNYFGLVSPTTASIGGVTTTVKISGQDVFITLLKSVNPNTEFIITLESPNPTVAILPSSSVTVSILTSDKRTTASASVVKSALSFYCGPGCASCSFTSDNCIACISGYVLQQTTCISDSSAFPPWLYPIFLLASISFFILGILYRYPFNAIHAVWNILSLIQMCYCILMWIIHFARSNSDIEYAGAVWLLFIWAILATLLAGVFFSRKITKFDNWKEKLSWGFGISVSRLGVISRRKKGTSPGWRLESADPLTEFESWRKLVNLIGFGTYLAVNMPFCIGGIILWITVSGFPYAIEAAIFQPFLGATLLGSWWELKNIEIKPEHQNLKDRNVTSSKANAFQDDSVTALNPLIKNIHLDIPDSLFESSKETQQLPGSEGEGSMSKTASRKGQIPNNKDSLIYIEDGQELPSSQLRSFVFDPENPNNNPKHKYKEFNKTFDGYKDNKKLNKNGVIPHNQIQLVNDPQRSQDSEEFKDGVGPLPPQKDYMIPMSSRLDTGRESQEEGAKTSRRGRLPLDHSPSSELNRRIIESELNGVSTPSGHYSLFKPNSDRYPKSISQRGNWSAGHELGNSLSSERLLKAVAAHLLELPTPRQNLERRQPLVADEQIKFPQFPKLELTHTHRTELLTQQPNKDTAIKVVPLSENSETKLFRESNEFILRPGKAQVSGRRGLERNKLPKNNNLIEVFVEKSNQKRLIETAPLVSVASKPIKLMERGNIKLAQPSRFKQNRLRERFGAEQRRYLEVIYEQAKIGAPPDSAVVEMLRGQRRMSEMLEQRPDFRLDVAKIKAINNGSISFDDKTGIAILDNSGERADHEKIHKIIGTDPRLLVRPEDTPESLRTRQRLLNAGIRVEAINSIEPAELDEVADRRLEHLKSKFQHSKEAPGTHRSGENKQHHQIGSIKTDPLSARLACYIEDPDGNHDLQDIDGVSDTEILALNRQLVPPTGEQLRSSQELLRKDLALQLKTGKASAKNIAEKAHEYGLGGKLAQLRVAIYPEDIVETTERLELREINGQTLEAFVKRELKFKDAATLPLRDQLPELMARGIYMDDQCRMLPVGDQSMEDVSRGILRDPNGLARRIATIKADDLSKGVWIDPETQKPTFVNGQPANSLASLLLVDRNGQKINLRKQTKVDIAKGVLLTENGTKVELGVPQTRNSLDKGEFKWKDGLLYRWIDQTPAELSAGKVRGMGRVAQPIGGYDISKPIDEVQSVWLLPDSKNKTNQNSNVSMVSNSSGGICGLSANEIQAKKKEFYDNDPYEAKKKPSEPLVFPEDTDSYLMPTSLPYNRSNNPYRGISGRSPLQASKSTVYNSLNSSSRGIWNNQLVLDTLLINLVAENNESFDLSVRIEETADEAPEEFVGVELSKPNQSTGVGLNIGPFNSSSTTSRIDSRIHQQPPVGMKYGRLPDLDITTRSRGPIVFDSSSAGNIRIDQDLESQVGRASLGDLKSNKLNEKPMKSYRTKLSPLIDIDTCSPRAQAIVPAGSGNQIKNKNFLGQGTSMPGTSTAAKQNSMLHEALQTIPFPANSAKQLGPIKKPAKNLIPGTRAIKNAYESSPKYTPAAPLQPPLLSRLQTTGQSDFLKFNYVDKLEREVERIKNRGNQIYKYSIGKGSLDRLDRTGGANIATNAQKGYRDA